MANHVKAGLASVIGASTLLLSCPTIAQQAPPAEPAQVTAKEEEQGAVIEVITVTARKFSERLQNSPVAVTAFSAAGIENRAISNLSEISRLTPSLTISTGLVQSGNPAATGVFMRGLGQADFAMFTEPAVGIYLDGVYIARSVGSALDFLDVARVEVLRGPQGTLFGRNTIGGVINVVSKRPSGYFGGDVSATIGSFDRRQVQGSVNVPLTETVRTKLSLYEQKRTGYVRQETTGVDLSNTNAAAARLQLEWEPSDDFVATVSLDHTRRRENPTGSVAVALSGTGFSPLGVPLAAGLKNPVSVFNRLIGGVCATKPDSSRNCVGSAWLSGNPYVDNGTYVDPAQLDVSGISAVLEWKIGGLTLKSISSARKLEAHYGRETDHTPLSFAQIHYDDNQTQFSQELQLNGTALDGRGKYVVGAYGFKENADEHFFNQNLGQATTDAMVRLHNKNFALFGEGTLDITPRWHATLGGRYTDETKTFQTDQIILASPTPGQAGTLLISDNSEQTRVFKKFTPRAILSTDLSETLMGYATYSKGFKSGGFNGRYTGPVPAPGAPIAFQPEYVTLYEGGLKFAPADRKFRVNLAIFQMDYKDIQVTYRPDPTQTLSVLGNAATARIRGAEVEATVIPVRGLQIEGSLSRLDARYTSLGTGVPTGPGGLSLSTPFQLTPKWQSSLSASYDVKLADGSSIMPRIDASYRSEVASDSLDSAPIRQPGYALVSANIAYAPVGGLWRFSMGGSNLTDRRYIVSGLFTAAGGVADAVFGRPREWNLTAKRTF